MSKNLDKFKKELMYEDFFDKNGNLNNNESINSYLEIVGLNIKEDKKDIEQLKKHYEGIYICPHTLVYMFVLKDKTKGKYALPAFQEEFVSDDISMLINKMFGIAVEDYDYYDCLKENCKTKIMEF